MSLKTTTKDHFPRLGFHGSDRQQGGSLSQCLSWKALESPGRRSSTQVPRLCSQGPWVEQKQSLVPRALPEALGEGLVPKNRAWVELGTLSGPGGPAALGSAINSFSEDFPSLSYWDFLPVQASRRDPPHPHAEPLGKQVLQSEGDAVWLRQATEEETPIFLNLPEKSYLFIWKHRFKILLGSGKL